MFRGAVLDFDRNFGGSSGGWLKSSARLARMQESSTSLGSSLSVSSMGGFPFNTATARNAQYANLR